MTFVGATWPGALPSSAPVGAATSVATPRRCLRIRTRLDAIDRPALMRGAAGRPVDLLCDYPAGIHGETRRRVDADSGSFRMPQAAASCPPVQLTST
jgi:hypothetical protein